MYFFLTSQKFEMHSHEGSMSNMVTNTDKQLDNQRKPGVAHVLCIYCADVSKI